MNMRNATCMGTETSKVPTRVTLLFIFYSVVRVRVRVRVRFRLGICFGIINIEIDPQFRSKILPLPALCQRKPMFYLQYIINNFAFTLPF